MRVLVRTRPLIPVAAISTQRTVTILLGEGDEPIAELAADLVTARSLLPGGHTQQWSEWEFELLGDSGNARLLKAATRTLTKAGAREPSSVSKLARAIGSTPAVSTAVPELGKHPTALDLVLTNLTVHRNSLIEWDPKVRVDADDAVHQMRVSSRRLRSVLTGFKEVLDAEKTAHLNGELRLLARILGDARDSEVQIGIDVSLLEGEDVSDALREALIGQRGPTTTVRCRWLTGPRIRTDISRCSTPSTNSSPIRPPDHVPTTPPRWPPTGRSDAAAGEFAGAELARLSPEGSDEWFEQLHVVRKKAKRLRYRADAVAALGKSRHERAGKVAKVIQSALGDVNDARLNRKRIAELVAQATIGIIGAGAQDLFVLGRVDARQTAAIDHAIAAYSSAIKDL